MPKLLSLLPQSLPNTLIYTILANPANKEAQLRTYSTCSGLCPPLSECHLALPNRLALGVHLHEMLFSWWQIPYIKKMCTPTSFKPTTSRGC